jgi:hypothetical protein
MKQNIFFKYVASLVVLVIVFLLGISVGRVYEPSQNNTNKSDSQSVVHLMIDYGNGTVKTYNDVSVAYSDTVFTVLKAVADKNNIDLEYKDYAGDMGVFLESINAIGKDSTGKKWWQFWVNGVYSQVGVSSYKVQAGDSIELKFTQEQQ